MFKKFFIIILFFSQTIYAQTWKFTIKGEEMKISPLVVNNQSLVPAKGFFENIGAATYWNSSEKSLRIVGINGEQIRLKIDCLEAKVNEEVKNLTVAPLLYQNQMFIPLKFVSEVLKCKIIYDKEKRTIHLYPQIIEIKGKKEDIFYKIIVTASAPISYQVKRLINPDRIVIDLPDNFLEVLEKTIFIDEGVINKIRCAQFQTKPPITRIVIDLTSPLSYKISVSEKGNQIYLYFPPQILNISYEEKEQEIAVSIKATAPLKYKHELIKKPDRLVIDFPGFAMTFPQNKIEITKEPIRRIRSAQFKEDIARVVLDLDRVIDYEINSIPDSNEIILNIFLYDPYFYKKKIMIDPGHGGDDPGAISPNGLYEKDINLEISKFLYEILNKAGADVFITREGDETLSLNDRVNKQTENNIEIFVSIHCNALPNNPLRNGVQVYYHTSASKDLAETIQKRMIKDLSLTNAGVKKAAFVVIKDALIPAVLVEVAFLTNPSDEALLSDATFRKKVAKSIFKGLREYIEKEKNTKKGDYIE